MTRPICTLALCLLAAGRGHAAVRSPRKQGEWVIGQVIQATAREVYVNIGTRFGLRPGDAIGVLQHGKELKLAMGDVWRDGGRATLPARLSPGAWPSPGTSVRARWREPTPGHGPRSHRSLPHPEDPELLRARWRGIDRRPAQLEPARDRVTAAIAAPATPALLARRVRGTLGLEYSGNIDLGSSPLYSYHRLALASGLDVPRLLVDSLDYSHRLRLLYDMAHDLGQRPFQDSRPHLLVYRARLGLSLPDPLDPRLRAEAGRLVGGPLVASDIVDGASVRVRALPGIYFGAYGGLSPRPDNLEPQRDATRFGTYVSLRRVSADWQLGLDAGFVGSTFRGELDRRAASVELFFAGADFSATVQSVVDFFPSHDPFASSTVDLTTLWTDLRWRPTRAVSIGLGYSRYRWMPTRELLAFYPEELAVADAVGSLRGGAEIDLSRVLIDVQGGWDRQANETWVAWGEVSGRAATLLLRDDLLLVGLRAARSGFLQSIGGRVSYWLPLGEALTMTAAYSFMHDEYTELDQSDWRHYVSAGASARLFRSWTLDLESGVTLGAEHVLSLIGQLVYRL